MTAIRHRSPSPWTARWLAVAIVVSMAVLIGGISIGVRVFGSRTDPQARQAAVAPADSQEATPVPTVAGTDPSPPGEVPPSAVPDAAAGSPTAAPTTATTPARPAAPRTPARQSPTPARRAPTGPAPPPAAASGVEVAVLTLVNNERAKVGCPALTIDPRLNAAARGHSSDMATRNYFAHNTPEGVGMSTRVTNAGYRWSAVAENIAMGQRDAASVMDGWMNSSGHRANIVNCRYRNLGVGMVANARGSRYWTQNFATPA